MDRTPEKLKDRLKNMINHYSQIEVDQTSSYDFWIILLYILFGGKNVNWFATDNHIDTWFKVDILNKFVAEKTVYLYPLSKLELRDEPSDMYLKGYSVYRHGCIDSNYEFEYLASALRAFNVHLSMYKLSLTKEIISGMAAKFEEFKFLIKDSTIDIIGAGGAGFWTAVMMCMHDLDVKIRLFDNDVFEESNRNRIPLNRVTSIGKSKAKVVGRLMSAITGADITWYNRKFDAGEPFLT